MIQTGTLHAPEDVDWWAFGVGEPRRGTLGFNVLLEAPGTCGTAEADWSFNLWATGEDPDYPGTPHYAAAAPLESRYVSYVGCDDSGGTSVMEWAVQFLEDTDLAFWWAEISAETWAEAYCGDSGLSTYTVTVVD